MILLSSYSTSWSENNALHSSTGELPAIPEDSVLIDIETLRLANAKLIELKYEKEINDSLRSIIIKDDELIRAYNNKVNEVQKQVVQAKRERNLAVGTGICATLLLVISLIVK